MAISVPFINARLEQQRLRFQALEERFAELRALLDQTLQRLTEARAVLVEIKAPSAVSERKERATERLSELAVVFQDNTRLALRLGGGHSVYSAHSDAMSALHDVEGQLRTRRQEPTMIDLHVFDKAVSAFMDASLDVLAVPLP